MASCFQSIKKMARERARATSIRVPQLKDCKVHFDKKTGRGASSMIFITEGQSAAGSIVSCRDVSTQAIFALRGKPLNVCDLQRDVMYKNEELYNLMRSLDVEDSVERLRYHRVIVATDADVDGLHIRNLLLTFFLRFFEPIVHEGYVHILETPLFRVRNRKDTIYCYSEAERDAAMKELRGPEVTRFKGLGEISPAEFKRFIGADMRLTPVRLANRHSVPAILGFYMGRNTPERRRHGDDFQADRIHRRGETFRLGRQPHRPPRPAEPPHLSLIDSARVIERILRHLKLWNHPERPPPPAPERSIHYDPEVIAFDDFDQRLEPGE
jgi:DNA gyrase/topoisomerase IV subunit B